MTEMDKPPAQLSAVSRGNGFTRAAVTAVPKPTEATPSTSGGRGERSTFISVPHYGGDTMPLRLPNSSSIVFIALSRDLATPLAS